MSQDTNQLNLVERFTKGVASSVLKILYQNQGTDWTASKLSRETGTVYAYLSRLGSEFEERGLITREEVGRSKYITLTEEGEIAAKSVCNHLDELERVDEMLRIKQAGGSGTDGD